MLRTKEASCCRSSSGPLRRHRGSQECCGGSGKISRLYEVPDWEDARLASGARASGEAWRRGLYSDFSYLTSSMHYIWTTPSIHILPDMGYESVALGGQICFKNYRSSITCCTCVRHVSCGHCVGLKRML